MIDPGSRNQKAAGSNGPNPERQNVTRLRKVANTRRQINDEANSENAGRDDR
jgi:hypothetical protein